MKLRWVGWFCGMLALTAPAMAHDFWMEPSTFRPAADQIVSFRLHVGDGFAGDPYARNPRHFTRFELLGPSGKSRIAGGVTRDPAGLARVGQSGYYVAVYESRAMRSELSADAFDRYIEEVGLDAVVATRAGSGAGARPVREAYSRCVKSLLRSGNEPAGGFDRVAGLTLELIPERDPLVLTPGEILPLRAEYEGRPLEGVLLRAFRRGADGGRIDARTDAAGRASLRIDEPGAWLVSAVHMVRSAAGADTDWESFWASLTLEVQAQRKEK